MQRKFFWLIERDTLQKILNLFIFLGIMLFKTKIKNITEKDYKKIELFQKTFIDFFGNNLWHSDEIRNFHQNKKNLILIGKEKTKITALGIFVMVDSGLEVYTIFVEPYSRNQMIGTNFILKAKQFCKKNLLDYIKLEVNKKNTKAIHFYKKNKFKKIGIRENYYDSLDDALIMKLDLRA